MIETDVNEIQVDCIVPIFLFISLFLPSITFLIVLMIQERRTRKRYLIKLENDLWEPIRGDIQHPSECERLSWNNKTGKDRMIVLPK